MLISLKFVRKVGKKNFSEKAKYTFVFLFACLISAVSFSSHCDNWTPQYNSWGISKVMCPGEVQVHKEFTRGI